MGIPRYLVKDAYTLEELRRQYETSDPKGRTLLLQTLYKDDNIPPYEIALMAVEDPHVEVRQWIARHGRHLADYSKWAQVYSERLLVEGKTDREVPEDSLGRRILFPERNLVDRLKSDPDPFVRACLRENPGVFGFLTEFAKATHLERLALVRNPNVHDDLIERIFDPEDQQLGIEMVARGELVCAFLSNAEFLNEHARRAGVSGHPRPADFELSFYARKFLTTLWQFASKWPKETLIPPVVYRYLPGPDEIKAQIYQSCDVAEWRWQILENCDPWEDTKTIGLGMDDPDETCRYFAYHNVSGIQPEALEQILQREGLQNLSVLSRKRSLRVEQLERICARIAELERQGGDYFYEQLAREILGEVREHELKRSLDKEVAAEFGGEIRDTEPDELITARQITALGKKLLSLEKEVVDRLARIEERLDKLER